MAARFGRRGAPEDIRQRLPLNGIIIRVVEKQITVRFSASAQVYEWVA